MHLYSYHVKHVGIVTQVTLYFTVYYARNAMRLFASAFMCICVIVRAYLCGKLRIYETY